LILILTIIEKLCRFVFDWKVQLMSIKSKVYFALRLFIGENVCILSFTYQRVQVFFFVVIIRSVQWMHSVGSRNIWNEGKQAKNKLVAHVSAVIFMVFASFNIFSFSFACINKHTPSISSGVTFNSTLYSRLTSKFVIVLSRNRSYDK
jgi:hypothetical protein